MSKIWLGYKASEYKHGRLGEIFRSKRTPTNASHGHRYPAVVGPFRTVRGAEFMRDHGLNNPHCQCVSQAERLGKKYAKTRKS